jgi:uncharacterized protein
MTMSRSADAGPVLVAERVFELDVLRGVALFGVLLINLTDFARPDLMATEEQLLALPTAAADGVLHKLLDWLVAGKAYTLFAFLFGLGFYVQMQRSAARGGNFDAIYLRRLFVLLAIGIAHTLFLWTWDILHLYALAGFILFALRGISDRALLYGGIGLAVLSMPLYGVADDVLGISEWHGRPSPYSDEAILARQAASGSGSYAVLFRAMLDFTVADWLLSGALFAWLAWSLGRFMIGAWVGRRGWFQDAASHLPAFRRVMRIALPAGLIICGVGELLRVHAGGAWLPEWPHWGRAGRIIGQCGLPVLALGYVCAVVLGLHTPLGRRLLAPFAQSGRMALTNYVTQSFLIAFILFGWGPGLGLAGRIGTLHLTLIVIAFYAAQVWLSGLWLARFRFGPLEWVWRTATYGHRP